VLQVILDGAGPVAKAAVGSAVALTTWYHLAFIASPFIGFNGYLMNESVARRIAQAQSAPAMIIVNSLPEHAKVLLIGEAQVFDARRPVIYSTVFNENVFEERFAAPSNDGTPKRMRSRDELKATLKDLGITHLLVNWNEVLRYRTTYGYSDFVTPENVRHLAQLGLVVDERLPATVSAVSKVADKGESTQFQLSTWGKSLIRRESDGDWYPAYELWRVVE
jgi:hypothetical protein